MIRIKCLFASGLVTMTSILMLAGVVVALEVGDKAPDFSLPSTTGEKISLSKFRGTKYVLIEFYVNDFGAT